MSQDLARYPQRPTSTDDLWMQQQALAVSGQAPMGMAPGGGGNDVQPIKLIHRSLRGRYKLAIGLAAAFAVVGAAIGWKSNERSYRAKGLVRIQSQIVSPIDTTAITNEYTRYMSSEANTLKSEEIIKRALGRPEWTDVARGVWTTGSFSARLTATYITSAQDIVINFDHPDSAVALAGVKAILGAYADYRQQSNLAQGETTLGFLESKNAETTRKIDSLKREIALTKKNNERGNIETRADMMSKRLAELEIVRDDALSLLQQMEIFAENAKKNAPAVNEELLAQRNPYFARLLNDRDTIKSELARLSNLGPNSPQIRSLNDRLASVEKNIFAVAEDSKTKSFGFLVPLPRPGQAEARPIDVNPATLANQRDIVEMLSKECDANRRSLEDLDTVVFNIEDLRNQISSLENEKVANAALIERAKARSLTVNAPFTTNVDPSAVIQEDKRPTMATFGFVAGAGLPIAALVALGLLDRKYRYSDETVGSGGTRGVPLLGILPNLPDRLSDPSQASVAAHCVHQIRTMLQLNCLNDGPSVLSVTSATSGDGKTSLSLALGLSFAASGSRTLLVDTDLIGGGLSARLGIREPVGIGEAIGQRDPMKFVRDTDVANLSVLPVGTGGAQNASAFSPTAVRRLVNEIRKHFDIVLIDTGPVLGSIEATPVVAASDAVILTVARGQNRDLVEKAIGHLRTIGARIAGVVFNRANAKDFERSISGISLRSVSRASASSAVNGSGPSTNGKHQDKRLGPLVHSVRGTRDETH